jgi:hypothetical protein
MYSDKGISTYSSYNKEHEVFIVRDHQGKVRKPSGYISNDLVAFTRGVAIDD